MNEWNLKKRKNNALMVYLKKVKIKFTAPDPCVASTDWMRRKNVISTFKTDLHLISHLYHPGVGDLKFHSTAELVAKF